MKKLIALLALSSFSAFSSEVGLTSGDLALSPIEGEIVDVRPICPRPTNGGMTCMAIGSYITVKVTLKGCVDKLGGHFSNLEVKEDNAILHFGAMNIHNELSERTRCIAPPVEYVRIMTTFEGKIEISNLNFAAK